MNLQSMSLNQLYALKVKVDTELRSHGVKIRSDNDMYFRYCSHCNQTMPLNSDYFYMRQIGYFYVCISCTQIKNRVNSQKRRDFLKTRKTK